MWSQVGSRNAALSANRAWFGKRSGISPSTSQRPEVLTSGRFQESRRDGAGSSTDVRIPGATPFDRSSEKLVARSQQLSHKTCCHHRIHASFTTSNHKQRTPCL